MRYISRLSQSARCLIAEAGIVIALIVFIAVSSASGSAADVPLETIRVKMDALPTLNALMEGDSNSVQEYFSLDAYAYEEAYYRYSESGLDARQLLILKCADESARDAVFDALSAYNDAQMRIFRDYAPDQYALLKDALLWTRGNYCFYAVSEHADEWEEAFVSLLR